LRSFAAPALLDAMLERVIDIARHQAAGGDIAPSYIVGESSNRATARTAAEAVSKLFRVHRHEAVFRDFCSSDQALDVVGAILGSDFDCFLSQFIFKHPGALGQPWHQDAFYFPFDRGPQVGLWLAVSEATLENGPLWVVPGSQRDPVHDVVPDRREHANLAYVEIVDRDMSNAVPVLMQPGDMLVFHSHLIHKSTDNESERMRAAMVFHYGEAGTVDKSRERFGFVPPNIDWMPVRGRGVTTPSHSPSNSPSNSN
jgi:phytanoyl-CoA hydroxylase